MRPHMLTLSRPTPTHVILRGRTHKTHSHIQLTHTAHTHSLARTHLWPLRASSACLDDFFLFCSQHGTPHTLMYRMSCLVVAMANDRLIPRRRQ